MASNVDVEAITTRNGSTQGSLNEGLDMITPNSFIDIIRALLIEPMREQYHRLLGATLEKLFEVATNIFRDGIKQARLTISASTTRSNFLKLPPELRNRVYEYALRDTAFVPTPCSACFGGCIQVQEETTKFWTLGHETPQRKVKHSSLLQVCRQVNREVAPMSYGGKTFHFKIDPLHASGAWLVKAWLKRIGEKNVSFIDYIDVFIENWDAIDEYLYEFNKNEHFKRAVKRGKKYKMIWADKGFLSSLGLLSLGVPVEKFCVLTRSGFRPYEMMEWDHDEKPDYWDFDYDYWKSRAGLDKRPRSLSSLSID